LVFRGACLSERREAARAPASRAGLGVGVRRPPSAAPAAPEPIGGACPARGPAMMGRETGAAAPARPPSNHERSTSDQVGIPAELKHINKRRKRNQQELPQ
jgi:hypothetical protein